MSDLVIDEVVGRKYWLGQLSAAEQNRVEELAFIEPASSELLQELENELIDDYISHDLTATERHGFETYFLSQPNHRSDLRIAAALQAHIRQNELTRSPQPESAYKASLWEALRTKFPRPLFVWGALATLLLVAAVLLGVRFFTRSRSGGSFEANRQVRNSNQTHDVGTQAQLSTPTPPANAATPGRREKHPDSPAVLSFLLVPGGMSRGDDNLTKIPLPARSALLQLELPLIDEAGARNYQVVLEQASDGRELRRWNAARVQTGANGKSVWLRLPSQTLEIDQRYRLVLIRVAADMTLHRVASYYFMPISETGSSP